MGVVGTRVMPYMTGVSAGYPSKAPAPPAPFAGSPIRLPVVPIPMPGPGQYPNAPLRERVRRLGGRGPNLPLTYKHPSGALQVGTVRHLFGEDDRGGLLTEEDTKSGVGAHSGPGHMVIDMHGGGPSEGYEFSNPGGIYPTEKEQGLFGISRSRDRKRKPPYSVYHRELLSAGGSKSGDCVLPPGTNPNSIYSKACNLNARGATPAVLADFIANQMTASGGKREPVRLNEVMMVPPGYYASTPSELYGVRLNPEKRSLMEMLKATFSRPEPVERFTEPPHQFRLIKGGDPHNPNHWTDTGQYADVRQSWGLPIHFLGEAKEYGRHLGLGKDLGGGDTKSYMDKIRRINTNPDTTWRQKVLGNFARPVGATITGVADLIDEVGRNYRTRRYGGG